MNRLAGSELLGIKTCPGAIGENPRNMKVRTRRAETKKRFLLKKKKQIQSVLIKKKKEVDGNQDCQSHAL